MSGVVVQPVDLSAVDAIVARLGHEPSATIAILQAIQEQLGYLPREALDRVCRLTRITPADIEGVSTFYTQFRHRPVGRHMISVCNGTACHVRGSEQVYEAMRRQLELSGDEDTAADGEFTLRRVACLGCCTLAPAVQIDDVTYGHLTPQSVGQVLAEFRHLCETRGAGGVGSGQNCVAGVSPASQILVGLGSCCQARGSGSVKQSLERTLAKWGISAQIRSVGCVGMCHQTPMLEIVDAAGVSSTYARVQAADVESIVLRHFSPGGKASRLWRAIAGGLDWLCGAEANEPCEIDKRSGEAAAFLWPQRHIATELCGQLDPLDLAGYRRTGGFEALAKSRAMSPAAVIAEVKASGLRGRGGAGFPTWLKWQSVQDAAAARDTGPVYLICNGDEGDPGAFMDRMLLESYPFRVIEGMLIAAHAVGAGELIFYIRAEYPLAVERVSAAIEQCTAAGLLAGLCVRVQRGAGAFVCGEETALIASIEGRRGTPRLRPPYPAQSGLNGRPTLVNNVETLAMVPWIVRHGGAEFGAIGTAASKGTKVFALAGKVNRGGLVEVPMGVTIGQIVNDIGGGSGQDCVAGVSPASGRGMGVSPSVCDCSVVAAPLASGLQSPASFKAVQIGGPSGGCIPAELAQTPVDYQALVSAGAIMGSGGLVVLDQADCMVEIARYFLEFTQDQSCGRCTFCRVGTRRMLDILTALCEGRARHADLVELERLAGLVKQNSLCGLGKTAPNPVLTTLRHFRREYEAHLQGRCPAGQCKALIRYTINDRCIGCTLCAQNCPADAIAMRPYRRHEVDDEKCTRCGTCKSVCPVDAVCVEGRFTAENAENAERNRTESVV